MLLAHRKCKKVSNIQNSSRHYLPIHYYIGTLFYDKFCYNIKYLPTHLYDYLYIIL